MSETFRDYQFRARAHSKEEYIYIIAEKTSKVGAGGYTGYYKVGRTDNLEKRLDALQTGNPRKLECVGFIQVESSQANTAEAAAHRAVRGQYQSDENGGTEWFKIRAPQLNEASFKQEVLQGIQGAHVRILDIKNIRWEDKLCTMLTESNTNKKAFSAE